MCKIAQKHSTKLHKNSQRSCIYQKKVVIFGMVARVIFNTKTQESTSWRRKNGEKHRWSGDFYTKPLRISKKSSIFAAIFNNKKPW